MLKRFLLFALCLGSITVAAQNPKKIIQTVTAKLVLVNSYTANGVVHFDIPSVKLSPITAQIYFKKPNKFRMHSRGIFLMPKQNPTQDIYKLLGDTSSYTAVYMGKEVIQGKTCHIINVLPVKDMGDFIVGKFWINDTEGLVYKSEITSKNAGTIISESWYGSMSKYGLPDQILLTMDVNKFKIPKMLALDINRKRTAPATTNKTEISKIKITFKDYKLNVPIDDAVF